MKHLAEQFTKAKREMWQQQNQTERTYIDPEEVNEDDEEWKYIYLLIKILTKNWNKESILISKEEAEEAQDWSTNAVGK